MRATALLAAALVLPALAAAPAPGASPPAGSAAACDIKADFNIEIVSVRNMSCRNAAREMRRHKRSISRRFTTPHNFTCTRVSGGRLGGQWRCVRRSKVFRFDFGD
jgi:hypothetical protein